MPTLTGGATDRETIWTKLLPLCLAMFTTAVAIAVFGSRSSRSIGSFYSFVTANRDTIGLMIQILSAVLGACQVYAITSILNLSSRLRLQSGRPVSFTWMKLCASTTAASIPGVRSRLTRPLMIFLILLILILKLPAALWAGSLTPLIVQDYQRQEGTIALATFPQTSSWAWSVAFQKDANGTVHMTGCDTSARPGWTPPPNWSQWQYCAEESFNGDSPSGVGLVAICPTVDLTSGLLGSLITASSGTSTQPRIHARVDGMGWTYVGRSYGVGGSAGMMAPQKIPEHQAPIETVMYEESGYEATVSCSFNTSTNYTFTQGFYIEDEPIQGMLVSGTLPNSIPGVVESYTLTSDDVSAGLNLFAWSTVSNNGTNMLAVAIAGWYRSFNQTQCTVKFEPQTFSVLLNTTDKTIVVTPSESVARDIEPTGEYVKDVFANLESISRISGSTVASALGTLIDHNRFALVARNASLSSSTSLEAPETSLKSLEDSIVSLLDDLFVTNAQAQAYLLNNTMDTPLTLTYKAVQIGSDKYIFAVFLTNALVLLLALVEMARTRFWRGLAKFDYTDIQAIAQASSAGGHSVDSALSSATLLTRSAGKSQDSPRLRLTREGNKYALYNAVGWRDPELELVDADSDAVGFIQTASPRK